MRNDPFLSSRLITAHQAAKLLGLRTNGDRWFERHLVSPDQADRLDFLLINGPHECIEPLRLKPARYRSWGVCPIGSQSILVQYLVLPGHINVAQRLCASPLDLKRRYYVWFEKVRGGDRPFKVEPFDNRPPKEKPPEGQGRAPRNAIVGPLAEPADPEELRGIFSDLPLSTADRLNAMGNLLKKRS